MTSPGSVIVASDVRKVYHIYDNPRDRLKELLSFTKKKYYREFPAIDGIDFEIGQGECVGIIGQNGCGKSTLLQMVCGILKPTAGRIETRGRISALLELGTGFNPEFTGRENIFLSSALMGFNREEIEGRYKDIVDFADIGDFIDQPIKTYSSGMYVRLAFACAVNVDPDILVVDEALSVGDIFFQQKCFRKMAEFRERGKTMLFVTHDVEAVLKNCGRAIYLDKGRIVKIGESRDVVNNYLEAVLTPPEPPRQEAAIQETAVQRPASHTPAEPIKRREPPEDRCKLKANYNKNEYRYGSFKANIVDFSISDAGNQEKTAFQNGEVMIFRYEVLFNEDIDFPIYAMIIKTKEGVILFGNNSWYEEVPVKGKRRGERAVVEFRQNMDLLAGDYFITAGLTELKDNELDPVDRRYDMAHLVVLATDKSFGVVNLHTKIEVKDKG